MSTKKKNKNKPRRLSSEEWMKKVFGGVDILYKDEYTYSYEEVVQKMEWYGEYVERKTKEMFK